MKTILYTLILSQALGSAADYHFLKKIPIGGGGWWDYLVADSGNRRLYVSHGSEVDVIDLDAGSVVGRIPAQGVHGIAIATDLNRGFISNGQSNTVTIFDLGTREVKGTAKAGTNPDGIIYDPSQHRVYAFNGRSGNATVIDGGSGNVVATLDLGGKPEYAAADGKGNVFVNIEDKSKLVHIDSTKPAVADTWSLAPCEEPSAMAIDAEHGRLFIGCHNQLMAVVDTSNGHVVTTVPIGRGVDAARFDPGTGMAFASCGEGVLNVIHEDSPDHFSVAQNVKTQRGARTMALDQKTHNVYLSDAEFQPQAPGATGRPQAVPDSFSLLVYGP